MQKITFRKWRWIFAALEAALLLGLPFVTINGQSALRFDVPSLRLYFFGTSLAIDEFYLLLMALLFLVFLFIALTMLFGRLWCGWACPQTVLSDLTGFLDNVARAPLAARTPLIVMYLAVALLSMLVAADLIWYFVSPYEFIGMLGTSPVVMWSFVALSVIIFMDLVFIRRIFCKTVCPYAKLQSVLFDERTMLIAYDPALAPECMGCAACKHVCPVEIDIRDGLDMACISCAECIDACTRMRDKVGKGSLVDYYWGGPGPERGGLRSLLTNPMRVNVLIALMASAVFLFMLVQGVSTRPDFAAALRLDAGFSPPVKARGTAVNSYILSIRNHTESNVIYSVRSGMARIVTRREIALPPGGAGRFTIYATVDTAGGQSLPETIKIEVIAGDAPEGIIMSVAFPASEFSDE